MLRSNEMFINSNKTEIMIFSNKKFISDFPFVLNYNDVDAPSEPDTWNHFLKSHNNLVTQQKLTFIHTIFYGYSTVHFSDFQILSAKVHYQLRNSDNFSVCRTNSIFIKKMPLIVHY